MKYLLIISIILTSMLAFQNVKLAERVNIAESKECDCKDIINLTEKRQVAYVKIVNLYKQQLLDCKENTRLIDENHLDVSNALDKANRNIKKLANYIETQNH